MDRITRLRPRAGACLLPARRRGMFRLMAVVKGKIGRNLARIRENIAAACERRGRDPGEVGIVAAEVGVGYRSFRQE